MVSTPTDPSHPEVSRERLVVRRERYRLPRPGIDAGTLSGWRRSTHAGCSCRRSRSARPSTSPSSSDRPRHRLWTRAWGARSMLKSELPTLTPTLTLLRAPPLPPLATAATARYRCLSSRPPGAGALGCRWRAALWGRGRLTGTAAPHRRITAGSPQPSPSPTTHPSAQPRARAAESVGGGSGDNAAESPLCSRREAGVTTCAHILQRGCLQKVG